VPLSQVALTNIDPTSKIRLRHSLGFRILEPASFEAISFGGRLYCTERALWKLTWFLHDFGYDSELLSQDQVDEKALVNLPGVVRTTFTQLNGRSYQNLDAFALPRSAKRSPSRPATR
jgi:hypothetical protein